MKIKYCICNKADISIKTITIRSDMQRLRFCAIDSFRERNLNYHNQFDTQLLKKLRSLREILYAKRYSNN